MEPAYEVKISLLDNGYYMTVVDKNADSRTPVAKYAAIDMQGVVDILSKTFLLEEYKVLTHSEYSSKP